MQEQHILARTLDHHRWDWGCAAYFKLYLIVIKCAL